MMISMMMMMMMMISMMMMMKMMMMMMMMMMTTPWQSSTGRLWGPLLSRIFSHFSGRFVWQWKQ